MSLDWGFSDMTMKLKEILLKKWMYFIVSSDDFCVRFQVNMFWLP